MRPIATAHSRTKPDRPALTEKNTCLSRHSEFSDTPMQARRVVVLSWQPQPPRPPVRLRENLRMLQSFKPILQDFLPSRFLPGYAPVM